MSDPHAPRDPIDQAYVEAQAMLDDEAARAARRARVLAAVAQDAAQAPPAPAPARRRAPWVSYAAAACVAGLGLFATLELYRPPERLPPPSPAPPPPAQPAAPPAPQAAASVRPAPVKASAPPPPPAIQPRTVPPPPMIQPRPVPPPPDLEPRAFPSPPPNAPAAPPAAAQDTAQSVDIGGQGARATLTLVDGQRLATAGSSGGAPPVPPPPAAASGGRGAGRGGAAAPQVAATQPKPGVSFNIPSQDAAGALAAWSAASGIKIDAPASLTRNVQTNAVSGSLDPRDALDALIAKTKLTIIRDDGNAIALGTSGNDTLAAVSVTATGTSIAGVRSTGSPIQRLNRDDLLKAGATDLRTALNPLPPLNPDAAALRAAASAGRTADIAPLLAKGVAVDAADADGNTALMLAIQADHPDTAALLKNRGASLDLANKAGRTARAMAMAATDAALRQALGLGP